MKRFILIALITCGAVAITQAQNSNSDRKAAKKAKKEQEEKLAIENTQKLMQLVEQRTFVLEAHTLFDRGGMSYPLSSNINFVGFDGKNSTIQLGFNNIVGWNGVGGVTLDGKIDKVDVKEGKKGKGLTANITVRPKTGGLVTMIFRISSDGNSRVDMSGTFGERFSFQGRVVSLAETSVYKGTPLF